MYCPNCATPTQVPDQNYCKNCGTNLLVVTQALTVSGTHPGPPAFPQNTSNLAFVPDLNESVRKKMSRIGWGMIGGGILVSMFFNILGSALDNFSNRVGHFIGDLGAFGALFIVAGIITLIYNRIHNKKQVNFPVVVVQSPNGQVSPMTTTPGPTGFVNLPPAPATYYEIPPSVTENTTAHLQMPVPVPYTSGSRDTK